MPMTERELVAELRRVVPPGSIEFREPTNVGDERPTARLPDGSHIPIDLRWAGRGFPRDVAAALDRRPQVDDEPTETHLIVGAHAISDGSRQLLDRVGASWFALDGSASIHLGTVWIERSASHPAPEPPREPGWSPARAEIAEVLLESVANGIAWDDERPRVADVETIARLAGRSLGSVANALAGFDSSGWTVPGPEPRSRAVADPAGLLDSWAGWEANRRRRWDSFHVLDRDPVRIEQHLRDVFGRTLILTGAAVSERVRPTLTGARTIAAYVDADWDTIAASADEVRMLPAATGRVRLSVAPAQVSHTSRVVDDRRVASAVRVYADLLGGSEREREAAELYRDAELAMFA
ncbi:MULTISPECIES: hypothetical protein [unclassified Curtobacterium]|uniref:hypothetical protein n=1 Tax=unclassified Curtobacterium TaxID=257496 RepID=UPI00104F88D7|nr:MULTISPECIES: hypothetical protein [unclassified Curtobacterium]